jgi:hypothetical protein
MWVEPGMNSELRRGTLRIGIAALAGLAFWALATLKLRAAGPYALGYDYTLHWWAGEALRRGDSPYKVINAFSTQYPFCSGYMYWLSTAVTLYPLSYLPLQTAMPIFAGISVAIFAYAITVGGWWRLPFLASAPLVYGALGGQVTPFVVAGMLVPSLAWFAPMKYTIATAGAAYTVSRRYVVIAAAVTLISVVLWPWWPRQWVLELHDVAGRYYHIPVLVGGGVFVLAALVRWRRPEARMLVILACVPQTMLYYDQLPLLLIARTYRQALAFALTSWVAPFLSIAIHGAAATERATLLAWNAPIVVATYYLPSLLLVLMRPNDGPLPRWLEARVRVLPPWLRGTPTSG